MATASDDAQRVGAQLLVDGRVPVGGGLSSSSALVCAAFMTAVRVGNLARSVGSLERAAELAADGERRAGVQCGGMDQAASILGDRGAAKLVSFAPLSSRTVPLPRNAAFVIANSLVRSEKATTSERYYNRRVVECRLAAKLLVQPSTADADAAARAATFAPRHGTIVRDAIVALRTTDVSPATLTSVVRGAAAHNLGGACDIQHTRVPPHNGRFTIDAVRVACASKESRETFATRIAGKDVDDELELSKRLAHVLDEAGRVVLFAGLGAGKIGQAGWDANGRAVLCNEQAFVGDDHARVAALGRLMNESHESCRALYECSCAELDELVSIARAGGAVGARLTGAGWGGCMVALVDADRTPLDRFLEHVKREYYHKHHAHESPAVVADALFVTRPSAGAVVMSIS